MAHQQGTNPYKVFFEQAAGDLANCIDAIHRIGVSVDQASHHLAWQGGSADEFHRHAGREHHHLHIDNDILRTLHRNVEQAAQLKMPKHTAPAGPAGPQHTSPGA